MVKQGHSNTSESPPSTKPRGRPRICPTPNRMFSIRLPVWLIDTMNEMKEAGEISSLTLFVIETLSNELAARAKQGIVLPRAEESIP